MCNSKDERSLPTIKTSHFAYPLILVLALFLCNPGACMQQREVSIEPLISQLSGSDESQRQQAAKALGEMGPDAAKAVPALIERLRLHHDIFVHVSGRDEVELALIKIGEPAVDPLAEALRSSNSTLEFRRTVLGSLAQIGPPAQSAIPSILFSIKDASGELGRQNLGIDSMFQRALLESGCDALVAIGKASINPVEIGLENTATASDKGTIELRSALLRVLGGINDDYSQFVPVVELFLKEKTTCNAAAKVIAESSISPGDVSILGEALTCEPESEVSPSAWDKAPILYDGISIPTEELLLDKIGRIGPQAQPVIPVVVAILEKEPLVRTHDRAVNMSAKAAWTLGQIGAPAIDTIPQIVDAGSRSPDGQYDWFESAVNQMGDKAIPTVFDLFERFIVNAPPIDEKFKYSPQSLRRSLIIQITSGFGRTAVPFLLVKLRSKPDNIAAAVWLASVPSTWQDLPNAFADEASAPWIKLVFSQGTKKYPDHLNDALSALTSALHSANPIVRFDSVSLIGDLGAKANPSLATVRLLLNDPDSRVRKEAGLTIHKIASP
jgi:HEAT repeat protein